MTGNLCKKFTFYLTGEEDEEELETEAKTNKDNPKGELKSHLNGLYSGLAKIMTTTCQIDKPKSDAPFVVEKAFHNIMFIKHHMKRQDEFDAVCKNLSLIHCNRRYAALCSTSLR
jgi:hypothetical protein